MLGLDEFNIAKTSTSISQNVTHSLLQAAHICRRPMRGLNDKPYNARVVDLREYCYRKQRSRYNV